MSGRELFDHPSYSGSVASYDTWPGNDVGLFYTVSQRKGDTILLTISLLNIDRFSQFFHRRTQLELCNKIINKDPTSPQMCCYTTLWNVPTRQCTGAHGTRAARQWSCCNGRRLHLSHLICGLQIAQISTQ